MTVRRIWSILLCWMMLYAYVPIAPAEAAGEAMPQTPAEYAAGDYGKYNSMITAGSNHVAAALQDGTVEVWGDNTFGQLELTPQVTGVKALAAGMHHTLALKGDATVAAWGWNSVGQCNPPAALEGKTVIAIAANDKGSAALTDENRIYFWGQNSGVLTSTKSLINIAMNTSYILALADDGTVEAWQRSNLDPVTPPEGFSGNVVAVSSHNGASLALKNDGTVVGWGDKYLPADLSGVRAVTVGSDFSAAILHDGTVQVWGNETNKTVAALLAVPAGLQAKALTAGSEDMFVLQADGTMVSWGRNRYGQGNVPSDLNVDSEISTNDRLVNLEVYTTDGSDISIFPGFSCTKTAGMAEVAPDQDKVQITAQAYSSMAALTINGQPVNSGVPTEIDLKVGDNSLEIVVAAAGGSRRSSYSLDIKRAREDCVLPPLPQSAEGYQMSEYAVNNHRLATSSQSVLAVKKDGAVIAWGQDQNLQIPPNVKDVVAVAAGTGHSLALTKDGKVLAWGYNDAHQCDVPADLRDAVDICIVGSSSLALDKTGKVWAWGQNQYGECNIPETLNGVVDIQGGARHVLALKANGAVAAWGNNANHQADVPVGLDHVVAISAGFRNNAALKEDGTIVTWGSEGTASAIASLNQHYNKGVIVGTDYVAALKMDGSVVAWNAKLQPIPGIPLAQDKKSSAFSAYPSGSHLVCLNEDGTIKVWANESKYGITDVPPWLNLFTDEEPYSGPVPDIPQTPTAYAASTYAQARAKYGCTEWGCLILNMDGTVKYIPRSISNNDYISKVPEGLSHVTAIAASFRTVMALREDGRVVVWGLSDDGQCNIDVVKNLDNVKAIDATQNIYSCSCLALKNDGTVTVWGNNTYGQCQVPDSACNVTAIAAGSDHFVALKEDGTVVAWGKNDLGQCNVPEGLNNVARVFAGYDYSLALKNDGTVVAWGNNYTVGSAYKTGQCDVPEGLSGVVDISLLGNTCMALKNDGTVVVWGDNLFGKRNTPPGLHNVAAVSSSNGGSTAIKLDGTIECWGNTFNFDDELLTGLSNVLTVAKDIIIFRDGTIQYFGGTAPADNDAMNSKMSGLNLLSGHYFQIKKVELLNSAGNSISTVSSQGGFRIQAGVGNNYASSANGLTIIQVRGGDNATSTGGGQVLGCVGISGVVPVTGAGVSSDFTLPAGISGTVYVDVFVWDDWKTMVPRAAADQSMSFTVSG